MIARLLRTGLLLLASLAIAGGALAQSGPISHVPGPRGPVGPIGPTGGTGPQGVNAYTTLSSGFAMPAIGATVSATVGATSWMAAGQVLFVANAGFMSVSSITSGTVVVLTNTGAAGNATPATSIASSSAVVPGGALGLQGLAETAVAASIVSGTLTIDLSKGSFFVATSNANIATFSIINAPTGYVASFTLVLIGNGTAYTQSWGSARWPGAIPPIVTFTSGRYDFYVCSDPSSTWFCMIAGQNL